VVRNLRICAPGRWIADNVSKPSWLRIASESANRVAKFWFCGLNKRYSRGVTGTAPGDALPQGRRADLPVRRVTVNSIVALNMAYFRKAAGLTQEELGERLGWGKSVVSTAERSWDARRVRNFSADDLIGITVALQIPLAALFLPPEDDGTAFRYVVDIPGSKDGELRDLLTYVFPGYEGNSPAMSAYRKRLIAAMAGRQQSAGGPLDLARMDFPVPVTEALRQRVRGEASPVPGTAGTETEGILEEARRQAEQITMEAAAAAMALEQDAQERHRQAVGSLSQTRDDLECQITELRAYETDYRTRLQTYIEGQLLELYTPETRQLAERRIREVLERVTAGGVPGASALLLREDGTYAVLRYPPGNQDRADAEQSPTAAEDSKR